MTTLTGLDLAGRDVLVVGGGPVATRRARDLLTAGALVHLVAPDASSELVKAADEGRLVWSRRDVVRQDVEAVWFVQCCTGVPDVDRSVAAWAAERRTFCVVASVASLGSARTVASSQVGDVRIGVLSTGTARGSADPRRSAALRDQITALLATGALDAAPGRPASASPLTLRPGQVALVGGGPGDPDLMTVRARVLLNQADIVVTDRLGPTALLPDLHEDVAVISVGKTPGDGGTTQSAINDLLVEHARLGRRVVRLKGGDPYVYGRGGEEVEACRAAGVDVVVVPGISSVVAAPAAAGIPLTHRGVADRFHVVSGHTARLQGGGLSDGDLAALLDASTTVVVLMGIRGIPAMTAQALAAGVDPATPVAVVMSATLPQQHVVRTMLGDLPARAAQPDVVSPAVIVLGEVAAEGFLGAAPPDPT